MVGPTKLPFSYPGTLTSLPSSRILAPWSIPDCTRSQTLCLASGEMTGPKSAPGSWPTAFHKQPYSRWRIRIMLSNPSFIPKLRLLGVFGCFLVFKVHECVLYLVFTLITPPAWSVAHTSIDLQFLGLLHQFWDPVSGLPNKHSCGQGHASLTRCTKGGTHQLTKNQTSCCYLGLLPVSLQTDQK